MKNVIVLGSTGSLGTQTLKVLEKYPQDFKVTGLSANQNNKLLQKQAKKLKIPLKSTALAARDGEKELIRLIKSKETDIVINVLSGIAGIAPTKATLKAGKTLLLGNKESMVADGKEIMALAKKMNQTIFPIDSEHNAIFEIIRKFPNRKVKKVVLPCSGGPFLGKTIEELGNVTAKEAAKHPKWKMGKKISIESATLINKGFEVIEAHYLFNLPLEKIDVVIHPDCKIHGIVEFEEEKVGYFGDPDMCKHIENALLAAIGRATAKREIRKIKDGDIGPQTNYKLLPGLKIVLENFRKRPEGIRDFLKKEEEAVADFLQGKINFADIFARL